MRLQPPGESPGANGRVPPSSAAGGSSRSTVRRAPARSQAGAAALRGCGSAPSPKAMTVPILFDRALHRARLDRAAATLPAAGFLRARAAEDAADRLGAILRDFPLAVELGARDGGFARALAGTPGAARVGALVECDLSARMLAGRGGMRAVVDEERLPFAPGSVNLVVSLLALHWTNDLPGVLAQIRRVLAPDGLLLAAFLGGATLSELRRSLLAAEAEVSGGAGPRVSPFADGVDAGALLQRAGFAGPVADVDRVVVRYPPPAGADGRPARHGRDQRAARPPPPPADPRGAGARVRDLRGALRRGGRARARPPSRSSPPPAGPRPSGRPRRRVPPPPSRGCKSRRKPTLKARRRPGSEHRRLARASAHAGGARGGPPACSGARSR